MGFGAQDPISARKRSPDSSIDLCGNSNNSSSRGTTAELRASGVSGFEIQPEAQEDRRLGFGVQGSGFGLHT